MSVAGVVVALSPGSSRPTLADGRRPRRGRPAVRPLAALVVEAALAAELDEVVVATDAEEFAAEIPEGATVLLDESGDRTPASALRAALDWCARAGHDAVVVAGGRSAAKDEPLDPATWRTVAAAAGGPVVAAVRQGRRVGPIRVDAQAWPLLPIAGDAEALCRTRPELVTEVEVAGDVSSPAAPGSGE